MRRLSNVAAAGIAGIALLTLITTMPVAGQVQKGKERPLKTRHLMKGLMAAQCGALKKDLDAGIDGDEAWDSAALKAELLNEVSYILMADGRCPDGVWAGAATTLRECSAAVLAAVESQDLDGAKAAFADMTKACATCHKAHRKES